MSILASAPWKLVGFFILGVAFSLIVAYAVAIGLGWDMNYGAYPTFRFGLISLVWWSYPYLIGRALSKRSNPEAHKIILIVFFVAIMNNTASVYISEVYGVLWYVILVTGLINLTCLLIVFAFPAHELKSMQLKRRVRFPSAFLEMIEFMIWPLSVWWLQKRLAAISISDVLGHS